MPAWSLPPSLADLLAGFRGCFTAPTFTTFSWLVAGFVAQSRARTVCGMLAGARLGGGWHHSRARRFFAVARWSPDQLALALLALICTRLVDPDGPLRLAVDDTCTATSTWSATPPMPARRWRSRHSLAK